MSQLCFKLVPRAYSRWPSFVNSLAVFNAFRMSPSDPPLRLERSMRMLLCLVLSEGIEPPSVACKATALPLDEPSINLVANPGLEPGYPEGLSFRGLPISISWLLFGSG